MKLALLLLAFVQVTSARPDRVEVTPAAVEIAVGETHPFTARAYDADGAVMEGATVRWFSTARAALSIDADGVATAHQPGTYRVAAVVQGVPGYA
ncbi:MAG: Ig-like domain-containing protein, partial [Rhodothermales bacterium]|nr:Ig-like domain-containing protein [Rhodothermales bacterium]